MNYLTHTEIEEKSFIMIDFEDGKNIPYYVKKKAVGSLTKATMLIGHEFVELLELVVLENGLKHIHSVFGDRYYIENDETKGHNRNVLGYRLLSDIEKKDLEGKIIEIKELEFLLPLLA